MVSKIVEYKDSPYESNEKCGVGLSYDLENTLGILKEWIRSCKVNNDKIMEAQEKQVEVN